MPTLSQTVYLLSTQNHLFRDGFVTSFSSLTSVSNGSFFSVPPLPRRCPGGRAPRPFLQEAAAVLRAVRFPGLRGRPEGEGDQTRGAQRAGGERGHEQRRPHRASLPRGHKNGRKGRSEVKEAKHLKKDNVQIF